MSSLAEFDVEPASRVMLPAPSKVRSPLVYVTPAGGVMVPTADAHAVEGLKAKRKNWLPAEFQPP